MASYRIEFQQDPGSGLFRAELYFPASDAQPVAATLPIYQTREEAREHIQAMFRMLSSQPEADPSGDAPEPQSTKPIP